MGLSRTYAVSLTGVDGNLIEVECDISAGLPGLSFTGLADASVVESRERVRSAIVNSGAVWPNRKVTVALFPADVRKSGSRFDLAVTMAILAAAGSVPAAAVSQVAWIAELGLDGRMRPVRGVLPAVLAARRLGVQRVVVAGANSAEAGLITGLDVRCADRLTDVLAALTGTGPPLPAAGGGEQTMAVMSSGPDLADVAGQLAAKRAMEIAAAGAHHVYLVGAPGSGKTMLAERLPSLLPPLQDQEALDVTALHSIAGLLPDQPTLVRRPPWQAPHHTASVAALVGGGSHLARPGAISFAHRGVLFLDEAPEFSPRALDALRQPLESGVVSLSRSGGTVDYPAQLQLVLAANPCPCGQPGSRCSCVPTAKRRHDQRLSGPLMDRIDLRLRVDPVARADLFDSTAERLTSAEVAQRVLAARLAAADRWRSIDRRVNAEISGALLRSSRWILPRRALAPAEACLERGELSARGFDRVLRVAWTLADLAGRSVPLHQDVAEALFFRTGRAGAWAA